MSGYILLLPLKSKMFKPRWHGIDEKYWFGVPRGLLIGFPKAPKLAKGFSK
jgi:hypothetical protein